MDRTGFDAAVEQSHHAVAAAINGDVEPLLRLFSQRDDATLANQWGPPVRGAAAIRDICERASSNYRDGEIVAFERLGEQFTPELAYTLEIVRFRVKLPGQDEMTPMAVRATSIYRPEDGAWKLVHRHADPITAPRGLESLTQT